MGIKEDRAARRSKFISLRHVIAAMSEEQGVSVGDVAGELILWLEKTGGNPVFYEQDPATLQMHVGDMVHLLAILKTVVRWGRLDWPDHSLPSACELDLFGWDRQEIGGFLLVFLGHFPSCCCPEWEPLENSNPPSFEIASDSLGSEDSEAKAVEAIRALQIKDINSGIFDRLIRAIEAFPVKYPDYERIPPKLTIDVRDWLHATGLVKDSLNNPPISRELS